jgi:hypothetical protein
MVEGEQLGAIARRVIASNQFMTIGTAEEEDVPLSLAGLVRPGRVQGVLLGVRHRGGGTAPACCRLAGRHSANATRFPEAIHDTRETTTQDAVGGVNRSQR